MKKEKGITMTSLVITIVILLILIGTAISAGIGAIDTAKLTRFTAELQMIQAKVNSAYEKIQAKDSQYIDTATGKIKVGIPVADVSSGIKAQIDVAASVVNSNKAEKGENPIVKDDFYYFDPTTLSQIEASDMTQEVIVNFNTREVISVNGMTQDGKAYYRLEDIPGGSYNVQYQNRNTQSPNFDTRVEIMGETAKIIIENIQYQGNVGAGSKWYKDKNGSYWNQVTGEEITVNKSGIYQVKIVDSAGNETVREVTVEIKSYAPYNKVLKTSEANIQIVIPKGFALAQLDSNGIVTGIEKIDQWQEKITAERIKNEGVVIVDREGNEYVWVPVDGTNIKYERKDFGNSNREYSLYSEAEDTEAIQSIATYKGFYIGRYEAGLPEGKSATNVVYNTDKPVSKPNNSIWNQIDIANARIVSEGVYNQDSGVKSKLISSYAWDTTMEYLKDIVNTTQTETPLYINNSQGMAWYTSNYTTGNPSIKTGIPLGNYLNKVKNIYDLGGNLFEWTTEQIGPNVSVRGGGINYGLNNSASYRGYDDGSADVSFGFRIFLFIK